MKVKLRTIGILFLVAFASFVCGAALFVYFGVYNISALKQHTQPVYNLLDYALGRAVKVRADEIEVPDLASGERIRRGAVHYQKHCLQCHGAPGLAPHDLAFGMTPEPVNLVSTAREWGGKEIYWVIKHGIKMSGMPAWEYRLSDEETWDVVAFVGAMARMTVGEYAAIAGQAAAQQAQHGRPPATASVSAQAASAGLMPAPAPADDPAPRRLSGNAEAGRQAMGQYLCATCHQIPGVTGATRHVGPPLNGMADRRYIGGIIANNPENMVQWLMNPKQFDPLSAMPDLGVNEKDAQDMTAYLYTLDDVN